MGEPFDPYDHWLGIPRDEQPPDHYRLLGVAPFETDREAIAEAADARMSLLRTYDNGARARYSQELLNKVARARVCLLDPQLREEYERELREQQIRLDLPPLAGRTDLVPREEMPMRAPDHIRKSIPVDPQRILSPVPQAVWRSTLQRWVVPTLIGMLAVAGLAIAVIVFNWNR